jgi:hypothetical protein
LREEEINCCIALIFSAVSVKKAVNNQHLSKKKKLETKQELFSGKLRNKNEG